MIDNEKIDLDEWDRSFINSVTKIFDSNEPHELNEIFNESVDRYEFKRELGDGFLNYAGQMIHLRTKFCRNGGPHIQFQDYNFDEMRGIYYYTDQGGNCSVSRNGEEELICRDRSLHCVPFQLILISNELHIATKRPLDFAHLSKDAIFAYKMFKQLRPPFE